MVQRIRIFANKTDELVKHRVLSIVLSKADSGKLLITEKYPINDGLGHGKLILPDSISPGIYRLLAYTDVLDSALKPVALFTANIYLGTRSSADVKSNDPKPDDRDGSAVFNGVKTQILTDKQLYDKREMVRVKIKLFDSLGRPVQGLFSISAAHATRLNGNEQKIMDVKAQSWDNSNTHIPPPLALKVKYRGKPVDKSVDIIFFGNSGLQVLSTDHTGRLNIERDRLLSTYGKKISMMVNRNKNGDYKIDLLDTLLDVGMFLARERTLNAEILNELQNDNVKLPNIADSVVELKTVTIKGRARSSTSYKGVPGINDCGDWVDEYDYLNYPYSQKRYHPIVGKLYKKRTDLNGRNNAFKVEPIYYSGCESSNKTSVTLIKGINLESAFYGFDQSSLQSQYVTTLFWGAALSSDIGNNSEIYFSTSDMSGEYRITLQGITASKVCYGEALFYVK